MAATSAMMGVIPFLLDLLSMVPAGAQVISLSDMYGTINSPNFPEPYPKESEVRWNISVPDGFQIRLYFLHFDLEPSYLCEYDYVKVEANGEELAVFCGREDSDTEQVPGEQVISSPRSSFSVSFRSDFSNEERFLGFESHYNAVDVDECRDRNDEDLSCDHFCHNYIGGYYCSCRYGYLLHSDNRTCRVECSDNVFTERSGVLSSSDFPNPYPKSSDCLYHIKLEDGFLLSLEFDDTFDIEDHPDVTCPYDYVKIQAGEKEYGPFCGDRPPGRIQTESNKVQVFFHSDNSGENIGWRLSYTSSGRSQCPVPVKPLYGQLDPVQIQYSFKDHVLVSCDPGYRLIRDGEELEHFQIECQKDGSWSSFVPICEMVDCGTPGEVAMGDVIFESSGNSTLFGSIIQYTCRESMYQIHPKINSMYTCGEKGEWTNSEHGTKTPTCLPVCGEPSQPFPAQIKRIVGGRSTVPGLFPWQVLLTVEDMSRVPEDRWFGSGALLSESWVLTAAHVLRSQRRGATIVPVAPEHIRVYLGLHDVRAKQNATNRSVEQVILHPHFDPRNYNNDIALVKLSQAVPVGELVRPVCLPPPQGKDRPQSPQLNTLGLVAGWGISNPNASVAADTTALSSDLGMVSDVLQYVKLPVVAQEECKASYASRSINYNITDNMFCAGFYEGGRDTCLGDSGGAFVMEEPGSGRWVAQGLVSWGGPEECGSQRVYGVYTRVANYADWLQSQLGTGPWW
ncbi:mannan-binding lectin serine protease 1 isoform X1 [Salmo salar]|uniref:Mannan-binding lectin serine protease 1 isoform X1 n=1 Tax=Salmo salar TaxID=8030 RepID=A0A1S3SX08_SALSA|nr:mannan-binding lectin serine protease 1 isoform X1 [Salmo salar]|eukprot:XP_014068886.1 PREDICTED: mannan-binding lectin serine protease 1 isoform X1 [Salmo salar]